jgi:F420-non-reducing hydrogenase small subunit
MRLKLISEILYSCSGCEISFLDIGERLLKMLNMVEIAHFPLLMDNKHSISNSEHKGLELPFADLGILSGGIRNEEHLEIAKEVRKKSKILIAFGSCATHGGIPALANSYTNQEILSKYYGIESAARFACSESGLPLLLDRCYGLDEKIRVEIYLPGCPPHSDHINNTITSLLKGNMPKFPGKSVCDTCPVIKKGKFAAFASKKIMRYLKNPQYGFVDEPLENMKCLLDQGFVCMGPVTRAGCGGDNIAHKRISARAPCQGCYGPVEINGNQRLDMLNALVSQGINISAIPNTEYFLSFSGAHNLLKPKKKKPAQNV